MASVQDIYNEKKLTAAEIAAKIESNTVIASGDALAAPPAIMNAIADRARAGAIDGVVHHCTLDMGYTPYYDEDLWGKYNGISWFSGVKARKAINSGYGDLMPAYFRDFPTLVTEYIDVDVAAVLVSPMNEDGFFSTGCTAADIPAIIKKAKRVYLEVNPGMPFVPNSPLISINDIDGFCESDIEIPTIPESVIDPISQKIGDFIAERIPDGATLQLGIGAVPDAVGSVLKSKKHLGIHSEMFTSSMVDLTECGAVDNSTKPIHTGKSVATFAFGSKKMYEFLDMNESMEMLPVDYVNDPMVIAKHKNFVSVNAALEVDFFGQVCAESIGTRHVSGTGGQVDFVQGANYSEGGQSFIAFSSTTADGKISKIKPILTPGAIVTTGKNDVDMIVTEYGVAKLRGQTLRNRVKNLIAIAHPDFRDELIFEAKQRGLYI